MRALLPLHSCLGALAALLLAAGPAAAQEAVYTVAKGDSLEALARRFGTSVETLTRRNRHLRASRLQEGSRLIVPASPSAEGLPRYRPPLPPGPPLIPCTVRRWPTPVETVSASGEKSACTTGPSGARVCAVRPTAETGEGLFLEEGGSRSQVSSEMPFMGQVDAFQVFEADLDGDGDSERVIATLAAVSNGLAVSTWTVYVLEKGHPTPLSFLVREYGEGTFLQRADKRGCDVLFTEWRDLEDPLRGSGLYFIGNRSAYREGALVPTGAPVRVRRYLREFRDDFQDAQGDTWRLPVGKPARWLSQGWAEAWPQDPLLDEPTQGQREGTVVAVERVKGEHGMALLQFQVRWDGGETTWLKPRELLSPDAPAEEAFEALGHLPTQQHFPEGYLPARPEALVGARVRQTFSARPQEPRRALLWLSDGAR
jgi:LysM repeat protein